MVVSPPRSPIMSVRANKVYLRDRPEATGVIGASVYILLLSLFAPLPYLSSLLPSQSQSQSHSSTIPVPSYSLPPTNEGLEGSLQFPHHSFSTYLATLLSLLIATFLGFCDDVFDIRWRFKLPIPRESTNYFERRRES